MLGTGDAVVVPKELISRLIGKSDLQHFGIKERSGCDHGDVHGVL